MAGAGPDSLSTPASYTISLPPNLAREWNLNENSTLEFLLAPTKAKPDPRRPARDTLAQDSDSTQRGEDAAWDDEEDKDEDKQRIDLSVELEDAAGQVARVALSRYGPVRKPLEMRVRRRQPYQQNYDLVLQSYSIRLMDFVSRNPQLHLETIRAVRFVFDLEPAGTVVVDNVGFSARPLSFRSPEATRQH
ncbi:MAG: hypothetical protein IH798_03335 [Gemmatimonadetes bacterium]|nr:hypothetical protein [Gemmatimonadota bacterium]